MNGITIHIMILIFVLIVASILLSILPSIITKSKLKGYIYLLIIVLFASYHIKTGFELSYVIGTIISVIYVTLGIFSFLNVKKLQTNKVN